MGKSVSVETVKQFVQKSAYSTDGSSRVVIEPDENVLLSLDSLSVLQIESALGGWEKGEPNRVTPTDPMNWSLYVTDKRIILWAPETITVMGGVKMKPDCATASVIYYDDLESVTLESESVNSYSFTVHVADNMLPFLSEFQGSRDVVEQITRAICDAWMNAVYMHDYDAAAREQTKMFLEQSWDKVREPGTAGVGLEKNRGSLVFAESQESDLQQAALLQQAVQESNQGSGLTGSKIYGYVIVALAVVGTIIGLSEGEGSVLIGGLIMSLYGVYLIRGGRWIIW